VEGALRIVRIRYRDGRPRALERISLPLGRFAGIGDNSNMTWDLNEFVRRHGVTLGVARERISNVRATVRVAGHLDLSKGTRLTKSDRVVFTAEGVPLEWRVVLALPK
jgi:DNA-binding GntR family transcriptional regulator